MHNIETSFVSLAVKRMIRITNVGYYAVTFLIINSNHSLDCQAHNRSFRLVCINLSSLCSPNAQEG